jgi:hypothetical protein
MESDPKATPINALPKGNIPQEDDQQFIQNILNQMKGDNQESEQNYQQTQQKYNNQQFGVNPAEQHERNQEQIQGQYEQEEQYEYETEEPVKQTLGDKLKRAIKGPLLFFILYVLLCFPFVRVFVANQIARFTENENFQLYGATILLGLVGGVIFYLVSTFLF